MLRNQRPSATILAWHALIIFLIIAAILLLSLGLLPYSALKPFFDHLARDGSFERFSPRFYRSIHGPFLVLGSLLLAGCAGSIWQARRSQLALAACFQWIRRLPARLLADFRRLGSSAAQALPPAWEWGALLVIVAIAVAARILFIQRGVDYDEGYTYIEFARHSFWQVMSDYHVPNNHVFHTLLVRLSTLVFGSELWAIRIPAAAAGLLIVPAVYLLGRKLYRPWIGLAAAGILSVAPVMINYSTNARGYTLIAFFTLLLFILADIVRKQKNLAAWLFMILIAGLGFYTIPIMLYPFGILVTWLLLVGLLKEIDPAYRGLKGWLGSLVGFGLGSAALSILFYLPIFATNGILTVFNGNRVVASLSLANFLQRLPDRLADVQGDWLYGPLPAWALTATLIGAFLSIFLHRRVGNSAGRSRVPVLLAAILFLVPFLLLQRPFSLARIWLFLLPLLVLSGAAGWSALLDLIPWPARRPGLFPNTAAALLLAVVLWSGGRYLAPFLKNPNSLYFAKADSAALVTQHLKEILRDGDAVVVSQDDDARYWYYFDYYKIPQPRIRDIKRHYFTRVLVISSVHPRRTVEQTVKDYGPDRVFLRMDTLQEIYRVRNVVVYQIDPNQAAVDQAFGMAPAGK